MCKYTKKIIELEVQQRAISDEMERLKSLRDARNGAYQIPYRDDYRNDYREERSQKVNLFPLYLCIGIIVVLLLQSL